MRRKGTIEDAWIAQIAQRAATIAEDAKIQYPRLYIELDLRVCHRTVCTLDLKGLSEASDADLSHDVFGIKRHLSVDKHRLEDCFLPRYAAKQSLGARKHLLLTKDLEAKLPKLGSTEEVPTDEKLAVVKFFSPYTGWTWYAVEGERQEDGNVVFFGWVEGFENEWGYFSLFELESAVKGRLPLVERDKYWTPKPMKEVRNYG